MLFTRRFLRRSRSTPSFRPAVLQLEDRLVPAHLPGPATHFLVVVPPSVQSGTSFDVGVEALDASNHLATGYTGIAGLSLGTADPNAILPGNYTFTTGRHADNGFHLFHVTLAATGSQTVKVTDTLTSSLTGSASTTVTPAPVATTLLVTTVEQALPGATTNVTVQVLDQSGHLMRNFTGAVTLSSTTPGTGSTTRGGTQASLPITYSFTSSDHGNHTFQVVLNPATTPPAAGVTATVTATLGTVANAPGALTGSGSLTLYPATTVTHFALITTPPVKPGAAALVTLEALNAANQIVTTGYTGTVSFSSSDTLALVSATSAGTPTALSAFSYQFTAAEKGAHQFYFTFGTNGQQTLTAVDSSASFTRSTVNVLVGSHRMHGWWGWW